MYFSEDVSASVIRYLESKCSGVLDFWIGKGPVVPSAIQDYCDVLYTLFLLGKTEAIRVGSAKAFAAEVRRRRLPGLDTQSESADGLSVHNFAYVLGTLNILRAIGYDVYEDALDGAQLRPKEIIDTDSYMPFFPKKFTHHGWRVSHWLGGVPSILLSLSRSGTHLAEPSEDLFQRVLDKVNRGAIDPQTGLIRVYKSELLQRAFKFVYGVRHDPFLGDLGGISHILWVNHAVGREFVNAEALFKASARAFMENRPFMEKVPYCLDFDIVQIFRTSGEKIDANFDIYIERIASMEALITQYFSNESWVGYSIHKLPGALAANHECRLIAEGARKSKSVSKFPDVIKIANWI